MNVQPVEIAEQRKMKKKPQRMILELIVAVVV